MQRIERRQDKISRAKRDVAEQLREEQAPDHLV